MRPKSRDLLKNTWADLGSEKAIEVRKHKISYEEWEDGVLHRVHFLHKDIFDTAWRECNSADPHLFAYLMGEYSWIPSMVERHNWRQLLVFRDLVKEYW